jgi:hypothetical protein
VGRSDFVKAKHKVTRIGVAYHSFLGCPGIAGDVAKRRREPAAPLSEMHVLMYHESLSSPYLEKNINVRHVFRKSGHSRLGIVSGRKALLFIPYM